MSALTSLTPPVLADPYDDPEHYELLSNGWARKESVGREDHSTIGQVLYELLRPYAKRSKCKVKPEWTMVGSGRKIIPDVTLSYPAPHYLVDDGYLVAPALLAVESRSKGQRLRSLIDKCVNEHHPMGTPYCWIIDVEGQCAYECHKEVGKEIKVPTLTLASFSPALSLSVSEIFKQFEEDL